MQDGRVLIVGGQTQGYMSDDRYTVAEAEIFDPGTKSFTPTGTLNQKRCSHGAVLLNDGKVLIAGGSGGSIFPEYKSVEIYDPSTGEFNLVGDMSDNRIYRPTCTLLPDGRVLIAGGAYEGWYANTKTVVDIYDPLTETLQLNVGDLLIGRAYGCAILLSDDNILFIGGYSRWNTPSSPAAELYDYTINTSNLPGIQPQSGKGYDYSAVSLSNGKVLVKKFEVAYPEYYDPITTTFEPINCEISSGYASVLSKNEKVLFTSDPMKIFNSATDQIEQSIDWPAGPGGFRENVVVLNDGSILFMNLNEAKAYLLVLKVANQPPTAPVLSSPLDGATGIEASNVMLEWNPSTDPDGDAIEYCLTVNEESDPEDIPVFTGCDDGIFISETSYTLPLSLESGKTYWWAVWARDDRGNWSQPSEWWNFTTTYSLEQAIELFEPPFVDLAGPYNNKSLYAVVNNCLQDKTYSYLLIPPNYISVDMNINWFAPGARYSDYGLALYTDGIERVSPYHDSIWNNEIRNEASDDDRFNTVYRIDLMPWDELEVISCIDEIPLPIVSTENLKSYFFTYDTINDPPYGEAVQLDDWINYLKAIKKHYERPIDRLVIFAHGTGNALFQNPEVFMSEEFTFNPITNYENTRDGFKELKDEGILSNKATILIFACYVGSGPSGRNFIQDIANWTGATVYANSDSSGELGVAWRIGPYVIHRNWDLDVVKWPDEFDFLLIQNLQAPLDSSDQTKFLFSGGIMVEIPQETLSDDGNIMISNVLNQLAELGINPEGVNTAYDITLQNTSILDQKSISIGFPYNTSDNIDNSNLTVEYWDQELQQWSDTGISDVLVNEEDHYVTFKTNHDSVFAVLVENQPPVANAGPDQTVSVGPDCTASVTLDGSSSSDPDEDPLTYTWTWDSGSATGVSPTIQLPLGIYTIALVVNDGTVDSEPDIATITVIDTTPPEITSIAATPDTLWPPDHMMTPVSVEVSATDNCDPNPVCQIISVTSNEPEDGLGDGDTAPDWELTGDLTLNLRAERSGKGDGREYTITVKCSDVSGNSSTETVTVTVPHDQDD
jgi:hypothetical protein